MAATPIDQWPSPASRFAAAVVLGALAAVGLAMSLSRGAAPVLAADAPRTAAGEPASTTDDAPPSRAASSALRLNLNTATKSELEMLPGVGPALADRIISDRDVAGAFRSVDDLGRVKGIGPRMLERLRGLVKVE